MQHEVSVNVKASSVVIWRLLTDVENWPRWTPSMQSVRRLDEGELRLGSKVEVKQPGMPKAVWTVTELEPGRSFAWTSLSSGVTTVGGHFVEPADDGARLTLTLDQTGPLAGAIAFLFGRRIRRWGGLEADGFRQAAEGTEPARSGT